MRDSLESKTYGAVRNTKMPYNNPLRAVIPPPTPFASLPLFS